MAPVRLIRKGQQFSDNPENGNARISLSIKHTLAYRKSGYNRAQKDKAEKAGRMGHLWSVTS